MKTYNTVEDILNDHELMDKEHFKISVEILRILKYNLEFRNTYESIKGSDIWGKTDWLKSEYERRQNKRYVRAVITPPETKVTVEFMEKKPNLIPFDLEKAKAGAKVWVFYAGEYLEANIAKDDLPSDLSIIYWFVKAGHGCITLRCDKDGKFDNSHRLFLESEPLPEMFSVEIPEHISWQKLKIFYLDSEYDSSSKLSDVLKSFVKSLN